MALWYVKFLGICIALTLIPVNGLAIQWRDQEKSKDIVANEKPSHVTEGLDRNLIEFLTSHHYTGCSVGVAKEDGTVIYTQGYGRTDKGALLKPSSELPVSSISKLITAVGLMKLVEDGSLTLSDFVFGKGGILSSLEPFPSHKAADQRLFDVRIYHLLQHTSGIQSSVSELNEVKLRRGHKVLNISQEMGLTRSMTLQDAIRYSAGQPLLSIPGTRFAYSNLGYAILGKIIEMKSGVPYSQFIKQKVLDPLGMWKTRLQPLNQSTFQRDKGIVDISNSPLLKASLGWHSTVHDILRFMNGLHLGRILEPSSFQTLLNSPPPPVSEHQQNWYGMGVLASNDGSWWQNGDPHTNEVIMYHTGAKKRQETPDKLNWVVLLTGNQHRNLKNDFLRIFGAKQKWPSTSMSVKDCEEVNFTSKCNHIALLNTQVPVDHFKAFSNALLQENYHPTWIDVYHHDGNPEVSSIWHKALGSSKVYHLETEISGPSLRAKMEEFVAQKMFLNLVVPYLTGKQQKYIALFSNESTGYEHFGLETTEDIYEKSVELYSEQLNLTPTTKSVTFQSERKVVSFMFDKTNASSWRTYDAVPLQEMKSLTLEMARYGRTLTYASSYRHLGQIFFSTIFADTGSKGIHIELEVDQSSLKADVERMKGRHFIPTVLASYEKEGNKKFLILWTREHCT
ncbi:Acyltransferase mlcH [Holothuria leucospilota]|uniref:Acyltransferase mlcH n=1 Tax=Holothuria leucospilota TaxID=206669 RepID=A0A9Q1HEE7_HOLLE|nr:Acyltransferase mlcH [Holothuria leucospilota]